MVVVLIFTYISHVWEGNKQPTEYLRKEHITDSTKRQVNKQM